MRVLEIPTPRWTAYEAKFFGLKDIPDEIPMVTQERAYTSPIWYTPQWTLFYQLQDYVNPGTIELVTFWI